MKREWTEEERREKIEECIDHLILVQCRLKSMGEKPTTKTAGEAWERRQANLQSEVRRYLRKIARQTELIAQEY